MNGSTQIGLLNTGLPIAIMATLSLLLPRLFVAPDCRSQNKVTRAMLFTSLSLLLIGCVLFAVIYQIDGSLVGDAFAAAPFATGLFFLRLSAMSALVWLPILGLRWFSLAQRVERLSGEDIARGDT